MIGGLIMLWLEIVSLLSSANGSTLAELLMTGMLLA